MRVLNFFDVAQQSVTVFLFIALELFNPLLEEIPSDEDEVNENRSAMQLQSSMLSGQGGDDEDEDDDEDYWDDDGFEGTPLEEYSTPLDYDNGEDAYHFFTSALLRKSVLLSTASH